MACKSVKLGHASFAMVLYWALLQSRWAPPAYVKNWLCLCNPFWFGGRGWDAYQAAHLTYLGTRYGRHGGVFGVLLLPLDSFIFPSGHFGPNPCPFPPLLTVLLPLYVLVRRRKIINLILLMVAFRFVTWVVSARNARYLMDAFPLLSVAVAYLALELSRRRTLKMLLRGTVFLLPLANLVWQSALSLQEDPLPVVLGFDSSEEYLLAHNDPPYAAIRSVNELPSGSKVLFVGSGQSYYVKTDHVPDVTHSNWGHLIYRCGPIPDVLHRTLLSQGFTHMFYSGHDFTRHLDFDADGRMAGELTVFDEFVARCAHIVCDAGEDGQVYAVSEDRQPKES